MRKQIAPLLRRARNSVEYRTGLKLPLPAKLEKSLYFFPREVDELRASALYQSWWYYTVELLPGLIAKGIYPDDLPMLPRVLLRNCAVAGAECLDVGSMEGLMPTLMRRRGARRVVAADAIDHCAEKIAAVKHYYEVDFEYKRVGLMYALHEKFPQQSFDLINLSGLLYHVFSPLLVLAGVRPLLKRNGLLLVSTGVVLNDSFTMEFNEAGRIQEEPNTFWYISVPLLEYMLRYLKLAPLDCVYFRHSDLPQPHTRLRFDKPSGYISIICRATDDVLPAVDDEWMRYSAQHSWEHKELPHWEIAARQPGSQIAYTGNAERRFFRPDTQSMNLCEAVNNLPPLTTAQSHIDAHTLKLTDQS